MHFLIGGTQTNATVISVTMNTYTHLGLEDAEAELRRVAESQAAREELEKLSGKEHSVIKFSREA